VFLSLSSDLNAPRLVYATMPEHRTWAEIPLHVLRANFRAIQQHLGANVAICAVDKADPISTVA
jgi:hypothetical protein